jgi:hypothetical protein
MSCLKSYRVGVVAHNCEPAIWEVEIMRTVVQGQPGQKVIKTPSQQTARHCGPVFVIPTTGEALAGGVQSKASPRQKV